MDKRAKNRLRDAVLDQLSPSAVAAARQAWERAWSSRRVGILGRDVDRARLAMLSALNDGATIAAAETIARQELARVI